MSYIIYYLELGWLHLSLTFCQSPYQLFKFPSFLSLLIQYSCYWCDAHVCTLAGAAWWYSGQTPSVAFKRMVIIPLFFSFFLSFFFRYRDSMQWRCHIAFSPKCFLRLFCLSQITLVKSKNTFEEGLCRGNLVFYDQSTTMVISARIQCHGSPENL